MEITDKIKEVLAGAARQENLAIEPELSRPAESLGDYATNFALQFAGKMESEPSGGIHGLAERLKHAIERIDGVKKVEVASAGFINIWLTDEVLARAAMSATDLSRPNKGKQILVEFGDPNPFKEMHIGHAYSYIVGDAISSLLEASGAKVERLSYHGDVGLHVAKAIWALQQGDVDQTDSTALEMGSFYVAGNKAYETDEKAKAEINNINQKIYDQNDSKISELCEQGRSKSFGYFDQVLKDLEVHPAERFLESDAAIEGKKLVEANIGKVFEKSDGAIVFKGEKVGLHTRVFITSAGLPTYDAKDLGLAELKKEKFPDAGRSLIVTAHEQAEYFKVMLAALSEIDKDLAKVTEHVYHGFVSLSSGKMSSRTGEVYGAVDLIGDVDQAVEKAFEQKSSSTRNAAIKYGFLKHRLGGDIVYDVTESISLEGNSGPYLQYAYARARSIIKKAVKAKNFPLFDYALNDSERSLVRKIGEYPEVVAAATKELMPSHICTYLYELAQNFNRFYESNRVIGSDQEIARLTLVQYYGRVLEHGLGLLNIDAPERI